MKNKIIYIIITIVVFLLGIFVGMKFFTKEGEKCTNVNPPEKTTSTSPETVIFDISLNHAKKENEEFIEDWTILRSKMAIQKGDTISSALYKNVTNDDILIKDIELKEDSVSFQLKEQDKWKSITLKYDENYKYLSKEYQYTNITVHKISVDREYKKLEDNTVIEKVYYEARKETIELEEEKDKIGNHKVNSLEELKAIANNEIVSLYKDYDFTKNSLYIVKSYGNRENNCYKEDEKITMVLSKDKEIHLVQEYRKIAETNCIPNLTDIKYRVYEIKGKYDSIILSRIEETKIIS